jgi:hypothetical protein
MAAHALLVPPITSLARIPSDAFADDVLEPGALLAERIWVEGWTDDVTDVLGHDPRSPYVERFWLGTLGPSATWLYRALAYGLESSPSGFELATHEMAKVLGLGDRTGRHSPMQRALGRLCQFELARRRGEVVVARRMTPWLEPRQVKRLSTGLQSEHVRWEEAEAARSSVDAVRRRAASLAMSTVRTGGTADDAERALIRWKVHPSLSRSMAEWAVRQHELADTGAAAD